MPKEPTSRMVQTTLKSTSQYFKPKPDGPRDIRKKIAEATLAAIQDGSYTVENETFDLKECTKAAVGRTRFYAPNSLASNWSTCSSIDSTSTSGATLSTQVSILEMSTIDGARLLAGDNRILGTIGVLNFASAKKPGGGFLSGAQAQEESIARSSNLYPTLMAPRGQEFYDMRNPDGFYTHAMIYSPGVRIFRDDEGDWLGPPIDVDVLTSAAVNAGALHANAPKKDTDYTKAGYDARIEKTMRERMARVLFVFEGAGAKHLVLGSFGTGVFKNDVGVVARLWRELLVEEGARFKNVFESVVFAILGYSTFQTFEDVFGAGSGDET